MISDLFALAVILLFFIYGFTRPSIALCGVIWVNNFRPQELSISFLNGQPLSAVITAFFFFTILINARSKVIIPSNPLYHILMLFWMLWITITTNNAIYPEFAWFKYDAAFKTVLTAYLIPFVLITKRDVEAFLWVCIVSFGTLAFFAGVKTLLGGGGYGVNLLGQFGGSLWSEGSTLATMCSAIIPICLFASQTQLGKRIRLMNLVSKGYALSAILGVIGTQARAGLVCLGVYGLLLLKDSKYKLRVFAVLCILPFVLIPIIPDHWYERMNTISSSESAVADESAMGRVVVWRWTLDFVTEHPFGGGFYAYRANAGQLSKYSGSKEALIDTPYPKAWHSIIFEVLGTQGYIGLIVFLSILLHTYTINIKKTPIHSDASSKQYFSLLTSALNISLLVYCAGGLFVNIAFYPWIYYVYGLSMSVYFLKSRNEIINEVSNAQSR